MPYREVLSLPIRMFWLMSQNVNRLLAERDMRALSVYAHAMSSDGMKNKFDDLSSELGKITKFEEVFDADSMKALLQSL